MSGSGAAGAGPRAASPQLRRVLSRTDLVVYGLTIITPTAAYPVFGRLQQVSNGHAALSYLIAVVAMLLTALSYGRMAAAFPSAGSTYTYATRSLHEYTGFLAGWSMILDYVLVPLLSAVYVALTASRIAPAIPYEAWAFVFAAGVTLVNLYGMRVTARASRVMMLIMTASTVLFVALAAVTVFRDGGATALLQPTAVLNRDTFALPPLIAAAAVATLSYLGFDAVSTLAEDTRDPDRDIGFATVLVCLLQTVFCFLVSYFATLVWPAARPFANVETAILDVSSVLGGSAMVGFTSFVLLIGAVASSVTSQAGASRLLYGMGRDGVLPRSIFGYLDPKSATPTRSICLMGAISFVGALLISFQTVVELVNFGAFVGFILVNVSVVRHYYLRLKQRTGTALWRNLLFPLAGAMVCAYVWMNLGTNAKLLGFA
ncbi:MAG TPA: APC family permease, partial [Bryobacteraceae bacterium]|nr:APC family permease [Bryobacteraceae bacterium]